MNSDQIAALIKDYDSEVTAIRNEAMTFAWYMRGGLTYDDAMLLSLDERKIINKIIESNIETTKKTGLPFF